MATRFIVEAGDNVELADGDFLRVKSVAASQITGILLTRTSYVQSLLPKQRNELCAILQPLVDGSDPKIDGCQVSRHVDSVVGVRQIIFTNDKFPSHSFRVTGSVGTEDAWYNGPLVCRRKYVVHDLRSKTGKTGILDRLREAECDPGKGVPDARLMLSWRQNLWTPGQKHTSADICAGAGGSSTAAQLAGLSVRWTLDRMDDACETLRLNFPDTRVLNLDMFDFCSDEFAISDTMKVAVLHISFPCQFFSPMHTHPGKDDDANEAACFSVIQLLKKIRPRVVTYEQTWGFVNFDHFNAFVHQNVAIGYNVRWAVVDFAKFGNVQARKRLITIASCPGEPLPPLPKPTHGDPPLQRFTTIHDILQQVPDFTQPHMRQFTAKPNRAPYDPHQRLNQCITTSGGEGDLHPDGGRSFNLQELSQLAGWPAGHRFFGNKTSIRRQIGNGVPALPFRVFFDQVLESLARFDTQVAAFLARPAPIVDLDAPEAHPDPHNHQVINLDDDDEMVDVQPAPPRLRTLPYNTVPRPHAAPTAAPQPTREPTTAPPTPPAPVGRSRDRAITVESAGDGEAGDRDGEADGARRRCRGDGGGARNVIWLD